MKGFLITLSLLNLALFSFGQVAVTGKILTEAGHPMNAATILEIGTSNGTISDSIGNFSLKCSSGKPSIWVSYVGFVSRIIPIRSDTTIQIQMEIDTSSFIDCYFTVRKFDFGLNGGINHNHFGIIIRSIIPYMKGFSPKLLTYAKWRFQSNQDYLSIRLNRYEIFRFGNIRNGISAIDIGLKAEYKYIKTTARRLNIYSVLSDFDLNFEGFGLAVGYAHRSNSFDESVSSKGGLQFELDRMFFNQFYVRTGGIYWMNDWQFYVDLMKELPDSRFSLGIGWEKLRNWQEVDISILYNLAY